MTFHLIPRHSRSTHMGGSSQLIWIDLNVFMCLIKSNVMPHMRSIHILVSVHENSWDSFTRYEAPCRRACVTFVTEEGERIRSHYS